MQPKTPQKAKETPSTPRSAPRDTATFTPYYWEAYNEIVHPRRFNHYLLTKWLPELGAVGMAIVLVLRDRCYHNRETRVLRDETDLCMEELAASIGVSADTIGREFKRNETLRLFVRPVAQYKEVKGRPQRKPNAYQVSMDDPIHPDDYERYDQLRAQKEGERYDDKPRYERESYKPQNAEHRASHKPQNAGDSPQNAVQDYKPQNADAIKNRLLSESIYTLDNATGGESPPINPPGDRGKDVLQNCDFLPQNGDFSLEEMVWSSVLSLLAEQVENGEINKPTFCGHLRALKLASLTTDPLTDLRTAVIAAPSSFTRDWVEKRHADRIRDALACVLGASAEAVTVEFRGPEK